MSRGRKRPRTAGLAGADMKAGSERVERAKARMRRAEELREHEALVAAWERKVVQTPGGVLLALVPRMKPG